MKWPISAEAGLGTAVATHHDKRHFLSLPSNNNDTTHSLSQAPDAHRLNQENLAQSTNTT